MVLPEVEAGICPLAKSLNEAVLHWVPMYVRHVMVEIGIVTNPMLPEPSLPYGLLTAPYARSGRDGAEMSGKSGGEQAFDAVPAARVVRIPLRQRPYCMEMIGQHHDRVNREWVMRHHSAKSPAQQSNRRRFGQ